VCGVSNRPGRIFDSTWMCRLISVDERSNRGLSRAESTPVLSPRSSELSREQAYVPAKQPQAQQDPWLPLADADSRWARHLGGSSSEGSQPARHLSCARPVLPPPHRLRRTGDFQQAVRRGRRVCSATMVVHAAGAPVPGPPRIGFVVGRPVGGAVVRNLVRRRLRELVRARLNRLPAGLLVVRATPRAASASYASLGADIDRCLERLESSQP
jgi:ribonuclease P protein component